MIVASFESDTHFINTKFTAYIKPNHLIPLSHHRICIFYSDGNWIFHDFHQNKLISEGKIDKTSTTVTDLIKSPQALDEEHIIFANCSTLTLECLNLYTRELVASWERILPSQNLEILVLLNTKIVGVLEQEIVLPNAYNYVLNLYQKEDKKPFAAIYLKNQDTEFNFSKANDEDTFIIWTSHQQRAFEFYYYNVNKPKQEFQSVLIQKKINFRILHCFVWEPDTVAFFGNSDEYSDGPKYHIYNFKTEELQTVNLQYSPEERNDKLIYQVIGVKPERKCVIFIEILDSFRIVVYNAKDKRAESIEDYTENLSFAFSLDKTYFVGYDGTTTGKENARLAGSTRIAVHPLRMNVQNKKIFLLFMFSNAKTKTGKCFLEYYGSAYIVQDIYRFM